MHPLHEYISKQLAERLRTHNIIVWYDSHREFTPFVNEMRGKPKAHVELISVTIGGVAATLVEYDGSMFEIRAIAEPLVSRDVAANILIYLPGCEPDRKGSVLMELEKAGERYEPKLKKLARNVLRQRYTDGVIDEMLSSEQVTYTDLARAASPVASSEPPSILKSIFHDTLGNDGLLTAWLANESRDAAIESKQAKGELAKLIRSRIGIELPSDVSIVKLRSISLRYILVGEFRSDLKCPPPSSLDSIPTPKNKDEETAVRELAQRLRTGFADSYPRLADLVEAELGLRHAKIPVENLGSIDTFRFEERALLTYCGELIAQKNYDRAITIVRACEKSFWLDLDLARKAQWEACGLMAELGSLASEVSIAVSKIEGDVNAWIDAYTSKGGWYRMDQAQRRLEALVTKLEEDAQERPLGVVRRAYDDTCQSMTSGFTTALVKANWTASQSMHQTRIFSQVVAERPKPVAYFLVDAMRFEMGIGLTERLPKTSEVSVRHAMVALPSITPIGMAALQPGASSSFNVVEQGGKLGVCIDDSFLPDLSSRKKGASARVPKLIDLGLDELLSLQPSKLANKVDGAQVIIVRSQEIDHAGEAGFTFLARQVMDTVIDNLARAIGKLAKVGVEHAVISADHGHLFFPSDRDESMRIEAPGGDVVELHRRCWIGRGGSTPSGCIRVASASLGYSSDLEFVFPLGSGVFKAGGDLSFHHGGPSMQETIVPVVTVRTKAHESNKFGKQRMTATGLPTSITNRIFSVVLRLGDDNLSLFSTPILVRPMLMSAGKQVGSVAMAIDAVLDRATGCLNIHPGKSLTVAFLLSDESVASLRVVVQDSATDADLYRSPADIPIQLGVK